MPTVSTKLSEEKLSAVSGRMLPHREFTVDAATKIVGPAVGGALIASFVKLGAPVLVVGAVAGAALGLLKVLEDHKHAR
jgi:predicted membrane protein